MSKKKKIRADFRKNRAVRVRTADLTRHFDKESFEEDSTHYGERVSGKGELTRRRTVMAENAAADNTDDASAHLAVDERACLKGRVLCVLGLHSEVQDAEGRIYLCATRRILRTLATDQRHVVAAGDNVLFRPVEMPSSPVLLPTDLRPAPGEGNLKEGFIERIEPRHGTICRSVRGRQHILVTNVDQIAIIASAAEPRLKPGLIDRMLLTAEKGGVRPIVCINKIDLIDPADLQPLVGVYARMGYEVLLASAATGFGIDRFRRALGGRASVLAGQSGVGKSSLLNAVDPLLKLRVQAVSEENEKGKHTTTTAQLLPLSGGGYVVDTPGIRQYRLWDVIPEEIEGFFRDLRPYINHCRYPNCTHTHEADCAVKDAVADGRLDDRRYESYCKLREGEEA
ncbi:MAG: ribosome small subunit-dependent GTPase A [Pirellulales bacterium]|nr:ribosome small subunit-dependent GTPase A [Pirellulales bacterium]